MKWHSYWCRCPTHIAFQITKLCQHWKSQENLPRHQRLKPLCLKQVIALQCQVGTNCCRNQHYRCNCGMILICSFNLGLYSYYQFAYIGKKLEKAFFFLKRPIIKKPNMVLNCSHYKEFSDSVSQKFILFPHSLKTQHWPSFSMSVRALSLCGHVHTRRLYYWAFLWQMHQPRCCLDLQLSTVRWSAAPWVLWPWAS